MRHRQLRPTTDASLARRTRATMAEEIPAARLGDRLFAFLQYLLPKHALSRIVYRLMRLRSPAIKNSLLRAFLAGYRIDMSEAEQPDPYAYGSFNEFFTRALRPGVRPIAADPQLRSEEHTSELQSRETLVCRLL